MTVRADMEDGLAKFDAMLNAIAVASSVVEVADIADMAEQLRVAAKKAKLGIEATNRAAEVKVRAERKAGELLASMQLRGGDRGNQHTGGKVTSCQLADFDIHPQQSCRWQRLASVDDDAFDSFIASKIENDEELTTAAALRYAKSLAPAKPVRKAKLTAWGLIDEVRMAIEKVREKYPEHLHAHLPELLRDIADEIEQEGVVADGGL